MQYHDKSTDKKKEVRVQRDDETMDEDGDYFGKVFF
jgi:hypothetical protein